MFINYYKIFEAIQDGSIKKLKVHEKESGNLCLHLPVNLSVENKWLIPEKGEGAIDETWPITICHPKNLFYEYRHELEKSAYFMRFGKLQDDKITFATPDNQYDDEFFEELKNKLLS